MLITYNHEKYVGKALESILEQQTDFDYEINVIEDCSTDRTQEVIRGYKDLHPDKINLYFNAKNIGHKVTQKNFYRGFKTLKGEYIAILEGDDYWDCPTKLQRQVDFLDAHPDFVGCAHYVRKIYEDGSKEPHLFLPPAELRETYTMRDFVGICVYFHTTTLVYRNVFGGKPPRQFRSKYSCDLFNTMAHVQFGKVHFIPEVMSTYRHHIGGRFSNMSPTAGWIFNIDGLRRYNRWLGYRFFRMFADSIHRYCEYLLTHGREEDGLTRWKRAKYKALSVFYRTIYRATDVSHLNRIRVFAARVVKRSLPHSVHARVGAWARAFWPRF